jgi:hypothetical protein
MTDPAPQKGEAGGECGRLLCRCNPTIYYSFDRGDWLCEGCGLDQNSRSWLNRPDGTPDCSLTGEPPSQPVPGICEDADARHKARSREMLDRGSG